MADEYFKDKGKYTFDNNLNRIIDKMKGLYLNIILLIFMVNLVPLSLILILSILTKIWGFDESHIDDSLVYDESDKIIVNKLELDCACGQLDFENVLNLD